MNTIMVIVLKVLFHHGLSLSYIMIHSVIFRNDSTNVSNSGKGVSVPCRVPPLPPRRGLGRDIVLTQIYYLEEILMLRNWTMGVGLVELQLLLDVK